MFKLYCRGYRGESNFNSRFISTCFYVNILFSFTYYDMNYVINSMTLDVIIEEYFLKGKRK